MGIGDKDPRWAQVLEKDNTGFRGLTSFAPIPCRPASEERYSEGALLRKVDGGVWVIDTTVQRHKSEHTRPHALTCPRTPAPPPLPSRRSP